MFSALGMTRRERPVTRRDPTWPPSAATLPAQARRRERNRTNLAPMAPMLSPSTMKIVRESGAIPNSEYLLEVENVRKEFPGVVALDSVSFRLKRGTVHALMGENGAGKSTLMKIIAGIYTPDRGTFKLRGQEILLDSPLHALEFGIAMI